MIEAPSQLREGRLRLLHGREKRGLDIIGLEIGRVPDSGVFQTCSSK